MALDALKTEIQSLVEDHGVTVLDCVWEKNGKDRILQVIIDHSDGVDIDLCVLVSNLIEDTVDDAVEDDEQFFLEVTSAGAERPFASFDELQHAIGTWIHVKLKEPFKGEHVVEGELLSIDDDQNLTIAYRDKSRTREMTVNYDDISFIRRAVKI